MASVLSLNELVSIKFSDFFDFFIYHRNGKLMAIGDRIGLPDDVSVGYVIGII